MKTPRNEDNTLSNEAAKKDDKENKKQVNLLSEDELDSVAGGVAPIIKPPTS